MNQLISVPDSIKDHIDRNFGLYSIKNIESLWLKSYKYFIDLVKKNNLKMVDCFRVEGAKGLILFTYSGSILILGEAVMNRRTLNYYSINNSDGLDERLIDKSVHLLTDIIIGRKLYFDSETIKNTSPIFKIGVFQ